jgi:UDP-glucuronate 4-epimerase
LRKVEQEGYFKTKGFDMKEILVTGGAGFIGYHLCDALLKEGHRVFCLDNMDNYYSPLRKEENIKDLEGRKGFTFKKGDIRDMDLINSVFKKRNFESIVHLAARAGVRASIADPVLYADVNVNGTMVMLEMARIHGIKRFIFASSSSVYGKVKGNKPFHEDMDADHPASPYGATKRSVELLSYAHHQIFGLSISALRLFTVYGPRQRPEMAIHKFSRLIDEGMEVPLYGDGLSLRDYTFVEDIVNGIIGALFDDRKFEIYNLGNSNPVKLLDMVRLIEKYLGKEAKIKWLPEQPGDVPMTFANNRKARDHFGFAPKVNIEEGIKRFCEWYQETRHKYTQCVEITGEVRC